MQQPLQNIILTSSAGGTTFTTVPRTQIAGVRAPNVMTSQAVILKSTSGKQIMAFPIQTQQGGTTSTTFIRAGNIKTEFGTQPNANATIIQQGNQLVGGQQLPQIIQAGNQRLLLTRTANGPQLIPISSAMTLPQVGQQLTTFLSTGQATSSSSSPNITSNIGPLNFSKQSFISPILDHTGARKRVDFPSDVSYESKRRKAEKGGKGLRHFSMKVCEKVRTKGSTTYNEVADELVNEFASPSLGLSTLEQQFDQKNIRRRVYDALNVLMAMNIISKEKKEIKWLGLPTNSMQECTTLEKDRQKRIERLKAKTQQLQDLITQQVAFKSLVERNKAREAESGPPPPHGSIHLPFLIVNTSKQTVIDCSISNDKMEYLFNFDGTFEIHDDIEVLKRMGLALGLDKNDCTDEEIEKAKTLLPKALEGYIDQIGRRTEDWKADFEDIDYEESMFHHDPTAENVFEVTGSLVGDSVDGISMSMNMSAEDLEMQAAIDSLHNQGGEESHLDEHDLVDEDSYGDGDEDDAQGLSDN